MLLRFEGADGDVGVVKRAMFKIVGVTGEANSRAMEPHRDDLLLTGAMMCFVGFFDDEVEVVLTCLL